MLNFQLPLDPDLLQLANSGGDGRLSLAIQAQTLRHLDKLVNPSAKKPAATTPPATAPAAPAAPAAPPLTVTALPNTPSVS